MLPNCTYSALSCSQMAMLSGCRSTGEKLNRNRVNCGSRDSLCGSTFRLSPNEVIGIA